MDLLESWQSSVADSYRVSLQLGVKREEPLQVRRFMVQTFEYGEQGGKVVGMSKRLHNLYRLTPLN